MNQEYLNYVSSISFASKDTLIPFKSSHSYTTVLEHISKEVGAQYLKQLEDEFPNITYEQLKAFVTMNDKYGSPTKAIFTTKSMKLMYGSPTSLRYAYHALIILQRYDGTVQTGMMEVGGGYGGLFLAINYFSSLSPFHRPIQKYIIIDLPEIVPLIQYYLSLHQESIQIPYVIMDRQASESMGNSEERSSKEFGLFPVAEGERKLTNDVKSVDDRRSSMDLVGSSTDNALRALSKDESPGRSPESFGTSENRWFFISNYCFTFVTDQERQHYRTHVLPRCEHGFLVWQTSFGAPISDTNKLLDKTTTRVQEEEPQTGPAHAMNYYVTF